MTFERRKALADAICKLSNKKITCLVGVMKENFQKYLEDEEDDPNKVGTGPKDIAECFSDTLVTPKLTIRVHEMTKPHFLLVEELVAKLGKKRFES